VSDDLAKFLFLGAMILIVFTSSRGAVYKYAANSSREAPSSVALKSEPPVFILEPKTKTDIAGVAAKHSTSEDIKKEEKNLALSASISDAILNDSAKETPQAVNDNTILSQTGFYRTGGEAPPKITAKRIIIADLLSGGMFFGLNEDERWPIASITKLLSATIVSKNISMHDTVTISAADFPLGLNENGVKEGESYSVSDLFWDMMLKSSNEATEALARYFGREKFIAAMNNLKDEWGLKETNFDDPTGLSASNQSTALDLLKLAKNIYERHPEVFETTRTKSHSLTEINSGNKVIINNINLFAGKDYFLGGKTGYTDEAGGNLLSIFSYQGKPIVIVVLGSDDRFGETEKLFSWFKRNYR